MPRLEEELRRIKEREATQKERWRAWKVEREEGKQRLSSFGETINAALGIDKIAARIQEGLGADKWQITKEHRILYELNQDTWSASGALLTTRNWKNAGTPEAIFIGLIGRDLDTLLAMWVHDRPHYVGRAPGPIDKWGEKDILRTMSQHIGGHSFKETLPDDRFELASDPEFIDSMKQSLDSHVLGVFKGGLPSLSYGHTPPPSMKRGIQG